MSIAEFVCSVRNYLEYVGILFFLYRAGGVRGYPVLTNDGAAQRFHTNEYLFGGGR